MAPRVLARLLFRRPFALAHVALALRDLGDAIPGVVENPLGLDFAGLEHLFALLERFDQRGDVSLVLRKTFFRARNDVVRQTQTPRNGNAVRTARDSLDQPIGGRELRG